MSRYNQTRQDKLNNIHKYSTTLYKKVEEKNTDIYVISQEGDRLDNLANDYYGSPHLWWFIARVNHLSSINVSAGTSLRIPSSFEDAVGV